MIQGSFAGCLCLKSVRLARHCLKRQFPLLMPRVRAVFFIGPIWLSNGGLQDNEP